MNETLVPNGLAAPPPRPFHRVDEVRRDKKISKPVLAKKLGIALDQLELLLNPFTDLSLRQLHWLANALGVTTVDVIHDHRSDDSGAHLNRKTLGELFTTATGLADAADSVGTKRMTGLLVTQLEELAGDAGISPASLKANGQGNSPYPLLHPQVDDSSQDADEDD